MEVTEKTAQFLSKLRIQTIEQLVVETDCRFTVTNLSCNLSPPLSTAIIDVTSSSRFTLLLDNMGAYF